MACPSDQEEKRCVVLPIACGVGAEIVTVEPTISGSTKGAVPFTPLIETVPPGGVEFSVRLAVRGSMRRVFVSCSPFESVTVKRMSMCAGYALSGAVNDPPAASVTDVIGVSWQLLGVGQRTSTTSQSSAVGGSTPSSASVPEPEKPITSPVAQVVPAVGVSMEPTGPLPTVISTVSVAVAPEVSVTRSVTVNVPPCR